MNDYAVGNILYNFNLVPRVLSYSSPGAREKN